MAPKPVIPEGESSSSSSLGIDWSYLEEPLVRVDPRTLSGVGTSSSGRVESDDEETLEEVESEDERTESDLEGDRDGDYDPANRRDHEKYQQVREVRGVTAMIAPVSSAMPSILETKTDSRLEQKDLPIASSVRSLSTPSTLQLLLRHGRIPEDVKVSLPPPGGRVCSPSLPPTSVYLYEDSFWAGLRIPIHPFFLEVLEYYELSPCQLAPNGWRIISGFIMLCAKVGKMPDLELFRDRHSLKTRVKGWYYFSTRKGVTLFDKKKPDSIKKWKGRFYLFHRSEPWGFLPWNHEVDHKELSVRPRSLSDEALDLRDAVDGETVSLDDLYGDEPLIRSGLLQPFPGGM